MKKQRKAYGRHLQISVNCRHYCYKFCQTSKERSKTESWSDGTYGGYIPEGPKPETAVIRKKTEKKHKPAKKQPFIQQDTDNTLPEPADASSEFEIHSAEEARKAIIWGEILQRKY